MNKTLKYCLVLSILVHIVIALPEHTPPKKQERQADPPVKVQLMPPEANKGDNTGAGFGASGSPECTKRYNGIGVLIFDSTGFIVKVQPGYPADRAGVKPGDRAIEPIEIKDNVASFTVERYDQHIHFTIKSEMICYDERSVT